MKNAGQQLRTKRKTGRLIIGSFTLPIHRIEKELTGIGFINSGAANSTRKSFWTKSRCYLITIFSCVF
jgi:hypothetical protein